MPPLAIAAVALGASVAGTAVSAVGQVKAGNAAQKAADTNAQIAVEDATIREQQQRRQDQAVIATARARIGTSGVTEQGSPLDVLAESARQAEMNALIIRRGGQLQAQSDIVSGKAAKTASTYGAVGTILTGAARAVPAVQNVIAATQPKSGTGSDLLA